MSAVLTFIHVVGYVADPFPLSRCHLNAFADTQSFFFAVTSRWSSSTSSTVKAEESLLERMAALKEMFPEPLQSAAGTAADYTSWAVRCGVQQGATRTDGGCGPEEMNGVDPREQREQMARVV